MMPGFWKTVAIAYVVATAALWMVAINEMRKD